MRVLFSYCEYNVGIIEKRNRRGARTEAPLKTTPQTDNTPNDDNTKNETADTRRAYFENGPTLALIQKENAITRKTPCAKYTRQKAKKNPRWHELLTITHRRLGRLRCLCATLFRQRAAPQFSEFTPRVLSIRCAYGARNHPPLQWNSLMCKPRSLA